MTKGGEEGTAKDRSEFAENDCVPKAFVGGGGGGPSCRGWSRPDAAARGQGGGTQTGWKGGGCRDLRGTHPCTTVRQIY